MFRANLFSRTVASRIESRGYMCHRQRVFGMVSSSVMSKPRVSGSVLCTYMMFARAHRPVFTRVLVASSVRWSGYSSYFISPSRLLLSYLAYALWKTSAISSTFALVRSSFFGFGPVVLQRRTFVLLDPRLLITCSLLLLLHSLPLINV